MPRSNTPIAVGLKSQVIPLSLLVVPILVELLLVQNPSLPALPWPKRPVVVSAGVGICFALVLPLLELKVQNFIYFQF